MKRARIVVLIIAIAAGGVAAMLAGKSDKAPEIKQEAVAPQAPVVEVLVAKADIPTGQSLTAGDVQWQAWPESAATGNFIRKSERPNAIETLTGNIARSPFVAGEPIREQKLVNAKGSGFMAAILPPGMRAISTQISPETSAGGFILPNDRVDVILTRRGGGDAGNAAGADTHSSEIVLNNIRVLAIDQSIEEKNGQKVVVGKTATLELTATQAETLALSQQLGTLSLALRSIADASKTETETEDKSNGRRKSVNIVRFGVSTPTAPR
jgi:pilus assembly protein CpaB